MIVTGSDSRLTQRRLVRRYRWPEAADRLRKAKAPYAAEAVHDQRAVLVRCTSKGAAALGDLASTAPAGIGAASKPKRAAPRSRDPLASAFARLRAEAQARAQRLDQEAAA